MFIKWIEDADDWLWKGYLLAIALLFANILNSLVTHLFFKHAAITAMHVRTAITTAIYRKVTYLILFLWQLGYYHECKSSTDQAVTLIFYMKSVLIYAKVLLTITSTPEYILTHPSFLCDQCNFDLFFVWSTGLKCNFQRNQKKLWYES